MEHSARRQTEHSWPTTVLRKWLNINKDSDFGADHGDSGSDDFDDDDEGWEQNNRSEGRPQSKSYGNQGESIPYRLRRSNSETSRAQYIDTKELRVCVGTWNVGGKLPPQNLDIEKWLDVEDPADIYVLGLQEIVPLNAGNIFGAEDSRPVPVWECIIRDTLNKIRPAKPDCKSYSNPPSPSRFKPSDDTSATVEELLPDSDSESGDEIYPLGEGSSDFPCDSDDTKSNVVSDHASKDDAGTTKDLDMQTFSSMRRLQRCHQFMLKEYEVPETAITQQKRLTKTLSSSERVGLVWPEQSLDLLAKCNVDSPNSFRSVKSFRASRSFKPARGYFGDSFETGSIPEFNQDVVSYKRRRSTYVRIVSKQMVGIYLTIWVRRPLRKYVQNVKVSTVGVGIMGYIGNKGSVSVSMSIYQTPFCFICTHLSSGEKLGDEVRRNNDVHEIHRRTGFCTSPSMGLPRTIHDHE